MGMTNSLSASGSHMERVGILHEMGAGDRESASHRAMAGESLTGSLSGSTIGAAAAGSVSGVDFDRMYPLLLSSVRLSK